MLLGRIRQVRRKNDQPVEVKREAIPELDEYLIRRDYTGAMAMLEFKRKDEPQNITNNLWLGHCAFHAGEYTKALEVYEWMLSLKDCPTEVHVYVGCCLFFMGRHKEAQEAAEKGPKSALQNRLLLLISHRTGNDQKVLAHHAQLRDSIEDQCCLATINYMRSHFHDAQEIYKRLAESNESFHAIAIYLGMCMYRQDYFEPALRLTNDYLSTHNDSVTVINLKAACLFRLYDGERAVAELKRIPEQAFASHYAKHILKHNLVVFQNGEAALQVLPALVDIVPEARANLIIFHLRRNELSEAHALIQYEPKQPTDYLLKAVVLCTIGYHTGKAEALEQAADYFQTVGQSVAECDTITGRQCMASHYFIKKMFEEVVVYLDSIKDYFKDDSLFNFNYGQAQLCCSNYEEAERRLAAVTDDDITADPVFMQSLARAYIMNKKPHLAWELYQKKRSSSGSPFMLDVIASDSYRSGYYYYAAKAYDSLERITNVDHWLAKRGCCAGLFQHVVNRRAPVQHLEEVLGLIERYNTSQAIYMITTISKWISDNKTFL
uniref:TPR_REGION domain-containing protein n=1 Tax=Steinernema glaseri TaxID=37863 RepID=A0A1I7ZQK1_9BILA